jgi:hypothetical protein
MVIVGLLLLGGIVGAFNDEDEPGSTTPDIGSTDVGGSSSYTVTYVVSGDSRQADVTYQNENGDTSQESAVSVPWQHSFTAAPGEFVYVSAQRGGAPGNITCTIELNGTAVETNTSSGPYTICTASGSV